MPDHVRTEDPARPVEPVRLALIGGGARSTHVYAPVLDALAPWVRVVAVCDPVEEHARRLADAIGARAVPSLDALVADGDVEAALVVTPIESHYAISVFLAEHGIHTLTETRWASTLAQGAGMRDAARRNGLIARVAENFFRFPVDRFAQLLRDSGTIGSIERIVSYGDHVGFHNCSRWLQFAGRPPRSVQAIAHEMPTIDFVAHPSRPYSSERFEARFYRFDGLLVADSAANEKGFLGRHPRPGYTEWQGASGTLVHRGTDDPTAPGAHAAETELRLVRAAGGRGFADWRGPVVTETDGTDWIRTWTETPEGTIAFASAIRATRPPFPDRPTYHAPVMGHVIDFANAIRGVADSEFDDDDALTALAMDRGALESALRGGVELALPLDGDLEVDAIEEDRIRRTFGVDPYDVEAMLAISYPRP